MTDLNSKLFVSLGASQVRRWLKGFGHGVCNVETAGNNKAVIVHTATGLHLRQLERNLPMSAIQKQKWVLANRPIWLECWPMRLLKLMNRVVKNTTIRANEPLV